MSVRVLLGTATVCVIMSGLAWAQPATQPAKPAPAPTKAPAKPAEKPTEKPAAKPAAEEPSMEEYAKAAAPGENHKLLEPLAGSWDAVTKWRMSPDAPWTESKATEFAQMWYGGRYLNVNFNGEFGGMEFKGSGVTGYNNGAKQFEQTWIDSMGTGIMFMTGTYNAATKSFTFSGDMIDPVSGKKKSMRQVVRIESADKHVEEFFEASPGGKEYKTMEITLTRKEKPAKGEPKVELPEKPAKPEGSKKDDGKKK